MFWGTVQLLWSLVTDQIWAIDLFWVAVTMFWGNDQAWVAVTTPQYISRRNFARGHSGTLAFH